MEMVYVVLSVYWFVFLSVIILFCWLLVSLGFVWCILKWIIDFSVYVRMDNNIILSRVYFFIIECSSGVMIKKLLLIMEVNGVIVVCYWIDCCKWGRNNIIVISIEVVSVMEFVIIVCIF